MINDIVNKFKELAQHHKLIKSFYYDEIYQQGMGNELYPCFWLEEPITGDNMGSNGEAFIVQVNFSITLIPNREEHLNDDYYQTLAYTAGLNIIEKIKSDKNNLFSIDNDWSFMTLTRYYDNDSVGVRFSLNLTIANGNDYCTNDDNFDENKTFDKYELIKDFDVNPNSPCEVFSSNKFPDFNIKVKK